MFCDDMHVSEYSLLFSHNSKNDYKSGEMYLFLTIPCHNTPKIELERVLLVGFSIMTFSRYSQRLISCLLK